MDQPPTEDSPRQRGALSILGQTLQGIAAPFAAAYQGGTGYDQLRIQQQNEQADLEFQKYLADKQYKQQLLATGKSIYTMGPDGGLMTLGSVPKGSQVIPPASLMTADEKTEQAAKETMLKDKTTRANKLNELNKVVDYFENKINAIPSGSGLQGRLRGMGLAVEGALQTNPDVAAYQANVEGLRSQIARGLGEVGNLSEGEQKYASKLLPSITDNAETRAKKLSNFRDYIKTKLGNSEKSPVVNDFTSQINKAKSLGYSEEEIQAYLKNKGLNG